MNPAAGPRRAILANFPMIRLRSFSSSMASKYSCNSSTITGISGRLYFRMMFGVSLPSGHTDVGKLANNANRRLISPISSSSMASKAVRSSSSAPRT